MINVALKTFCHCGIILLYLTINKFLMPGFPYVGSIKAEIQTTAR